MIYRFEIENFGSIRERQIIDLRADANASNNDNHLAPIWKGSIERAPKVIAIYGPNASGKSTVLRAFSWLTWFVRMSFSNTTQTLNFPKFNSEEGIGAPTKFMLYGAGPERPDLDNDSDQPICSHAYELELSPGVQQTIQREALYFWPGPKHRKTMLFERDADGKVRANKLFGISKLKSALETILRPDASVISTLAQLQHPFSVNLCKATQLVQTVILEQNQSPSAQLAINYLAQNPLFLETVNNELARVDVGITKLQIHNEPSGSVATFLHEGHSGPLSMAQQSEGTRNFIRIMPMILFVLQTGGIALIDELDSSLHPTLLPEIVRWFHDSDRNPHNAQIWTTCHNTALLEHLEKEEVLFTEKDRFGRTSIYALADIQGVRRGENFSKKYLSGVYGAVPMIG